MTHLIYENQQYNKSYNKRTAAKCIFMAKLKILSYIIEINHFVLTSIVPTLSNPCDLPTNASHIFHLHVWFYLVVLLYYVLHDNKYEANK